MDHKRSRLASYWFARSELSKVQLRVALTARSYLHSRDAEGNAVIDKAVKVLEECHEELGFLGELNAKAEAQARL